MCCLSNRHPYCCAAAVAAAAAAADFIAAAAVTAAGTISEQLSARFMQKDRGLQGPVGLLARVTAGARGTSPASHKPISCKNVWPITVQATSRTLPLAKLAKGDDPHVPAAVAGKGVVDDDGGDGDAGSEPAPGSVPQQSAVSDAANSDKTWQHSEGSSGSASASRPSCLETNPADQPALQQLHSSDERVQAVCAEEVEQHQYTWIVSAGLLGRGACYGCRAGGVCRLCPGCSGGLLSGPWTATGQHHPLLRYALRRGAGTAAAPRLNLRYQHPARRPTSLPCSASTELWQHCCR